MPALARLLLLLLALMGGTPDASGPAPQEGVRYAFFPMRNLSTQQWAPDRISVPLLQTLRARGATFVPAEELELALSERRIRYTDSVSVKAAQEIGQRTGAGYILVCTMISCTPSPEPEYSVALRVIDVTDGSRVQSSVIALRGEDFTGLLGLGTIHDDRELALEVVARLLDVFDATGAPLTGPEEVGGRPGLPPSEEISRFVKPGFELSSIGRVAVLPMYNRSEAFDAGRIFSELFGHQCFRLAGLQVVEQSELRDSMIRARIRSVEELDSAVLVRMGRELDTRYFVLGSVDRYRESVIFQGDSFPEIEASVRIVDVEADEVVAAAGIHRTGFAYEGLLELGGIVDPVALALRVAAEIVTAMEMGD